MLAPTFEKIAVAMNAIEAKDVVTAESNLDDASAALVALRARLLPRREINKTLN